MNTAVTFLTVALVAAALAWRWRQLREIEDQLSRRLPLDAHGIISGAEPISLEAPGDAAVLLVHGAGDTPQTMHYLATAFHRRGYAVHAPLLPGHGRTLHALSRATADEWTAAVANDFAALQKTHSQTSVVGFSLGGALAVQLAATEPALPALVLIAPYLILPRTVSMLARLAPVWGPFLRYLRVAHPGSVLDPHERAQNLAFGVLPAPAFRAIQATARRGVSMLPHVTAPTLMVQSLKDNRITAAGCRQAFAALGARDKRLELLDEGGHVVTVDYGHDRVIELAIDWVEAHAPRSA